MDTIIRETTFPFSSWVSSHRLLCPSTMLWHLDFLQHPENKVKNKVFYLFPPPTLITPFPFTLDTTEHFCL